MIAIIKKLNINKEQLKAKEIKVNEKANLGIGL